MPDKVLLICKHRSSYGISYGLYNSAKFVAEALNAYGIEAKVVDVIDNNGIDREVHNYKPTIVILEALWVVPSKFDVLLPLYPNIKWFVRLHSKPTFIANEGIAFEWLKGYREKYLKYKNLFVSTNTEEFAEVLTNTMSMPVSYMPNIYDRPYVPTPSHGTQGQINIGCFGSVRPMKNHLSQALAAILYANDKRIKLRFHINGNRLEQHGDQVYKNLCALFEANPKHELVQHLWMPHEEFLQLIRQMDVGMQVSLSESFNIVAADFVSQGIPIVVSPEIEWMPSIFEVDPWSVIEIANTLSKTITYSKIGLHNLNRLALHNYNVDALAAWLRIVQK